MATFLFLVGATATTLLFIAMTAEEVMRTKRSLFGAADDENIQDIEDGPRQSRGKAIPRPSIQSPPSSHQSVGLPHGTGDWDRAA